MQRYEANVKYHFKDGSVGWAPGGKDDCIGPFAKVLKCQVRGTKLRCAVYAIGLSNGTAIPACTRVNKQYIGGWLILKDGSPIFTPSREHFDRIPVEDRLT